MTEVSKKALMLFVYIIVIAMITTMWSSMARADFYNDWKTFWTTLEKDR